MLDSAPTSATVTGLPPSPPDAPASPGPSSVSGGGSSSPSDDARARKRESDRAAKQRQRARERASAPADNRPTAVPAEQAPLDIPPVVVRFKGRPKDARVIEVDELSLEHVAEAACSTLASVTGDGRFVLLAGLKLPNGRSLASDVGFAADSVLALHGIRLTPEATVYAQLAVSLATVAAILSQVPKLDAAAAEQLLPTLQQNIGTALGGGTH